MKKFQVRGGRILKTSISILLTATICELLHWPPVFAVITAIVTIEPTVSDSIRKGVIRFPASAIGSLYAVIFISLFGNSPLTYTLAGTLTIVTCYKLKLHAGLLVATITSVAMVEVIHDHFFISFLIRLGTTTIGLGVSTLVNMLILPPNYQNNIETGIHKLRVKVGEAIAFVFEEIMDDEKEKKNYNSDKQLEEIKPLFYKIEKYVRFQKDESKYHPLLGHDKEAFNTLQDRIQLLRMIHYNLVNLINTPLELTPWSKSEKEHILAVVYQFKENLVDRTYQAEENDRMLKQITEMFWEDNEEITKNNDQFPTNFPPELIILYELITIGELVKRYFNY
ncbi:FUSC family protein [Ornithinibacillus halotolerans]|uniref:UPF0421 protein n=1 Tax=Ornithinibacillus halotolerans TaxID=1274357 RepID=A0A916RZM4_9BACI|nr:aromatic acid exporter family protein [Ornithinibacillus halotolerans]GGA77061.1 UPF0421 protein [Ornithinibacillus halotolerans]